VAKLGKNRVFGTNFGNAIFGNGFGVPLVLGELCSAPKTKEHLRERRAISTSIACVETAIASPTLLVCTNHIGARHKKGQ
jgi:phosphoribosylformylglycinamidine (FGAM) synthase-like enzyme